MPLLALPHSRLKVDVVTDKVLRATASVPSAITGESNSFTVHSVAASITFSTQPSRCKVGSACLIQPVVSIVDAGGRIVSAGDDASRFVTLAKASGTGSLGGNLTVPTASGKAMFTNVMVSDVATTNLVLTATCGSLSVGSRSVNSEVRCEHRHLLRGGSASVLNGLTTISSDPEALTFVFTSTSALSAGDKITITTDTDVFSSSSATCTVKVGSGLAQAPASSLVSGVPDVEEILTITLNGNTTVPQNNQVTISCTDGRCGSNVADTEDVLKLTLNANTVVTSGSLVDVACTSNLAGNVVGTRSFKVRTSTDAYELSAQAGYTTHGSASVLAFVTSPLCKAGTNCDSFSVEVRDANGVVVSTGTMASQMRSSASSAGRQMFRAPSQRVWNRESNLLFCPSRCCRERCSAESSRHGSVCDWCRYIGCDHRKR